MAGIYLSHGAGPGWEHHSCDPDDPDEIAAQIQKMENAENPVVEVSGNALGADAALLQTVFAASPCVRVTDCDRNVFAALCTALEHEDCAIESLRITDFYCTVDMPSLGRAFATNKSLRSCDPENENIDSRLMEYVAKSTTIETLKLYVYTRIPYAILSMPSLRRVEFRGRLTPRHIRAFQEAWSDCEIVCDGGCDTVYRTGVPLAGLQ